MTNSQSYSTVSRLVNPALLTLVLSALYGRTLATGQALMDGVEFALSAASLGIAHPSSYPLFCNSAFGWVLAPLGNIAYRVAWASAIFAALTAWGGYLVAAELIASRHIALATALLLGTGEILWSQGGAAEVYSLHGLALAALTWAALVWLRTGRSRWWLLASFLLGLSFANHQQMLLALPGLGVAALIGWWRHIGRNRAKFLRWAGLGMTLGMLGLSVNLYLPLRSSLDPVVDQGDPERSATLARTILLRVSSSSKDSASNGAANFLRHWERFRINLPGHVPWPMLLLALPGLWRGFRRRPDGMLVVTLIALVSTLMAMWSFYSRSQDIAYMVDAFLQTGFGWVVICVGLGAEAAAALVPRGHTRTRMTRLAVAVLMLGTASLAVRNFHGNDRSREDVAARWARAFLEQAPSDAVVIAFVDELFPLLYEQLVEGRRLDVRVMHQVSLMYFPDSWWTTIPVDVRCEYPLQGQAPRTEELAVYQRAVGGYLLSVERPLMLTRLVPGVVPEGFTPMVTGLGYRIQPERAPWTPAERLVRNWENFDLTGIDDPAIFRGDAERNILDLLTGAANNGAGLLLRGYNLPREARKLAERSTTIRPGQRTSVVLLSEIEEAELP